MPDPSSPLYLYDDAVARTFEPFALTRPAGELRAGAELVRRRWERAFGTTAAGFVGAEHLATFEEFDAPPAVAPDAVLPAGAWLANARFAPRLAAAPKKKKPVAAPALPPAPLEEPLPEAPPAPPPPPPARPLLSPNGLQGSARSPQRRSYYPCATVPGDDDGCLSEAAQ